MTGPGHADALRPSPRLLRADEVQLGPDDRAVHPSAVGHLLAAGFFFALAAWMGWKHQAGEIRWAYAAAIGGVAALFGCSVVAGLIEMLRKGEWLMVIGPGAILVRFHRRQDPNRPSGEPQVVELPVARIESVQRVQATRSWPRPRGEGKEKRSATYLDFRLSGMNLGPLAAALGRERARRRPGRDPYPSPGPVLVVGEDVLRVEVSGTRMGGAELLRLVGAQLPMEEDFEEQVWMGGPPVRKPLRARGARE